MTSFFQITRCDFVILDMIRLDAEIEPLEFHWIKLILRLFLNYGIFI
jgi:hypothetical protein